MLTVEKKGYGYYIIVRDPKKGTDNILFIVRDPKKEMLTVAPKKRVGDTIL